MKILTDFHHSSLLKSLVMLFEDRLGHELYRPIGMEWFEQGYWAINNQEDTAKQYLEWHSQPLDGTPELNEVYQISKDRGWAEIIDPNRQSIHKACTLDYFKRNQFDIVIASIPAHIEPFKRLIAKYQPNAKLIIQMGNEWPLEYWRGHNVLASVKPRPIDLPCNPIFYHQEFDLQVFESNIAKPTKNIYSFINILSSMSRGWNDFLQLEHKLPEYNFRSYGGQCRDGNMNGDGELANKMFESEFIFHVKDNGDGFGHIIHNAYAIGRPVITRSSDYVDKLAGDLLIPGTFIDLNLHSISEARDIIRKISDNPYFLAEMSRSATLRFNEIVNYYNEAKEIEEWLNQLK